MNSAFTESVVEEAALAWLESAAWQVCSGAEISPGEPAAKRDDYGEAVLMQRLRDALLQPLISCELRVQEAERAIKETTV